MRLAHALVSALLLLSAAYLVGSVTRTITDTQDNLEVYIRNSNGKHWEATGSNIQAAIDDLDPIVPEHKGYGGTHEFVWLPPKASLTIDDTLVIEKRVTLDMRGSTVAPSGDFDVMELREDAHLRNGIIDVSQVGNYDSAAVTLRATDRLGVRGHIPMVRNMELVSDNQRGKGVYIYTSGLDNQAVIAEFHEIKIREFEYGILFYVKGSYSFANGNIFTDITGYGNKYFITLDELEYFDKRLGENNEVAANCFQNIRCYCSPETEYVIWNNGQANIFDDVVAYDWDNNGGTRAAYNFSGNTSFWYETEDGIHIHKNFWGGDQCYLSFRGGGEDLDFAPWIEKTVVVNATYYITYENEYMLLELEKGNFTLERIHVG